MAPDKTQEYLQARRTEIQDADYADELKTAILDFLDAYDPEKLHIKPPIQDGKDSRDDTLSTSSRLAYASTLHRTAKYLNLTECRTTELNRFANKRLDGSHESAPEGGVAENTIHQNQIAWRKFARFHQDHPKGHDVILDPDEIVLVDREETKVDERDMFDSAEVKALREACQNKRDRALLEMLIYTGQRHNALRKLTYDDVKPSLGESGVVYLPDEEGMKGAEGKRPLLGAQKAAREWKRSHPTQEPADAFFTHIYDWSGHDTIEPGDFLSRQTFGQIPKRIAERAGVDKPTNPHQFRHYFAHSSVANHGMSMDTVRHLLGHAPGSRELERTYQHLVDDDYIENAEMDMGLRDERQESLTPPQCVQCDEPLEPSWSICPNCEYVYGPDAQKAQQEIEDISVQAMREAETEEEADAVESIRDWLKDNPEDAVEILRDEL